MTQAFHDRIAQELTDIAQQGLTKPERVIASRQGPVIRVGGREVLNFCANNYLGLAGDERVTQAGIAAQERWGAGTASVRFICGTLEIHKELEAAIADYLGFEDAILFAAAFDANGGLFEPLLGADDAIVSDSLNHASIIDGVRLCKAKRYRYANNDMSDLEVQLLTAVGDGARFIMIATDGVFSMDGYLANLPAITALAEKYGAITMVDDCHATGFMGPEGRGTPALSGVKVDILTGTLGKALGGALGGYIAGPRPVIDLLRQRARPYLFSNALPPAVVAAALAAFDIVEAADDLRAQLFHNAEYWRSGLESIGFRLLPGMHPIIPVMLGEAPMAQAFAKALDARGVMVSAFFYPVVPRGGARIRTQMNAKLTMDDLDMALEAFEAAAKEVRAIR